MSAEEDPEKARKDRIEDSLAGIEQLIHFVCRNAIDPKEMDEAALQKLIKSIAQARELHREDKLSGDAEVQFYSDFRALANAFKPVTISSVRDSQSGQPPSPKRYIWWGPDISRASAAVRRFTICSVLALGLLLYGQVVWVMGNSIVTSFRELEKRRAAVYETVGGKPSALGSETLASLGTLTSPPPTPAAAATPTPVSAGTPAPGAAAPATPAPPVSDPEDDLPGADDVGKPIIESGRLSDSAAAALQGELALQEEALVNLLRTWRRYLPGFAMSDLHAAASPPAPQTTPSPSGKGAAPDSPPLPADARKSAGSAKAAFIKAEIAVDILQVYCMPLLYGLMGACCYVLRQLILEMRQRVFRSDSEIAYWVRLFLGVLAGLAIGWFLRPQDDSQTLISGIKPFALAFLAGYSVELFFSAMDRLVQAFGSTSQQSPS